MIGKVHSFQSLGTVDGPGIRFVVFLQGCPLRCGCCHNPDTWDLAGGTEYTPEEIVQKATRFKEYFGKTGGITVSGGEPLLQAEFVKAVFKLCHDEGINTCLDTSGCILNDEVKEMLTVCDRVLLDIKYTNQSDYLEYVGCEYNKVLEFLEHLESREIPTTLRQVVIPTLTDSEENVKGLKSIVAAHKCVDKVELLPFRKICQTKYDGLKIPFRFRDLPEPQFEVLEKLNSLL